jgi:hypothetical protein
MVRAPIVGTNGGALKIPRHRRHLYSPYAAGCTLIPTLIQQAVTTGATTVTLGTLKLGASEVLPNGTTLTLNGGDLDILTNSETVAKIVLYSANSTILATTGGRQHNGNEWIRRAQRRLFCGLGAGRESF